MRSLALVVLLITTGTASAHFTLMEPPAYSKQDSLGLPEKSPPCGQADPGTPMVSVPGEMTYAAGDTITLMVDENIFHPGHYRVAIAQDEGSMPVEPVVTMDGDQCGSAAFETTPTLPVLGDNLLVHTTAFSSPQPMTVTLPAGFTCAHCLLQVIEFMSQHPLNVPGGCFYHHCARVSITNNGVDAPPLAPDVTPVAPAPGGCCDVHGSAPNALLAGIVLGLLARRRRRRQSRT